jgi:riboflavin synthase alpha subunit
MIMGQYTEALDGEPSPFNGCAAPRNDRYYTAGMFTGIVQAIGRVARLDRHPFGIRLVVDRSGWTPPHGYRPAHGDSICVSGVCLTVVDATEQTLAFDVIAETLAKTTLGDLAVGGGVNLEPAVTPNQPLGGHFMQGHVDGVGVVEAIKADADEWRVTIQPPGELMDYIVPKGSVAIDGVSLTIATLTDTAFDVALIPTTLELTTLRDRKAGDRVNLEADVLSKTIVHYLRRMGAAGGLREAQPVTMALLEQAGFTG